MVGREYNSSVCKTPVKSYLNIILVSEFVSDGTKISVALVNIYELILKYSRQISDFHCGDERITKFLCWSLIGCSWSNEPLFRVTTDRLSFQQSYGDLEYMLQLNMKAHLVTLRNRAGQSCHHKAYNNIAFQYTEQRRYMHRKGKWITSQR